MLILQNIIEIMLVIFFIFYCFQIKIYWQLHYNLPKKLNVIKKKRAYIHQLPESFRPNIIFAIDDCLEFSLKFGYTDIDIREQHKIIPPPPTPQNAIFFFGKFQTLFFFISHGILSKSNKAVSKYRKLIARRFSDENVCQPFLGLGF